MRPPPTSEKRLARRVLNGLLAIWVLGYLAMSLIPIIAANGQGTVGAMVGPAVGFGAAIVLFVPWVIGLIILLVLRWTSRAR